MDDKHKIDLAQRHGINNVAMLLKQARRAKVPFGVACALMEKESRGRNVYGNDSGGTLSGFPGNVTKQNWEVFRWLVIDKGQKSNGVGPCQLTYKGFFTDMESEGLQPWRVADNMYYGLRLLRKYKDETGSWQKAAVRYNGSETYGRDFAEIHQKWKRRLGND